MGNTGDLIVAFLLALPILAAKAWCRYLSYQRIRRTAAARIAARECDERLEELRKLEKQGMMDADAATSYYKDAASRADDAKRKQVDDFTFLDFILGRSAQAQSSQSGEDDNESEISLAQIKQRRQDFENENEMQKAGVGAPETETSLVDQWLSTPYEGIVPEEELNAKSWTKCQV